MLFWHARYVVRRLSSEYALSERCTRSSVKLAVVTASGDDVSGFRSEMCWEFFCSCHCSVEPLWRQRRTFLSSCHTQDCNSTGILPITECDLILTDGADELRCAAAFFYSSSAEILKTFSRASFPIMIWAFSRTAADASSCPGSIGLPWPQPAPPEALAPAHLSLWKTGPLCKYRLLWPYFGFAFFPCLPAVIDAPTLCSGGSPAGFKREAHRGFVAQSQEDQIQVENSRHFLFSVETHNETEQSKHLFFLKSMLSPHHWWSLKRPSRKLEPKVRSWLTGSTGTVQGSLPAWCQLNSCAF